MKQGWPCVDKFWSWVMRDSFYYSLHICIHLKFSMKWGNKEKPCMTFVEKITKDLKEELKIYFSWMERLHMISVQFSCSVVSDSLRPHGLQDTRPSCPSPTPGVYSNSCPLSWWCHQTISSSVIPFSSHLQFSQHQGLFKWVSSSHQVAKVLQFQFQHQSFQWICRTDFL